MAILGDGVGGEAMKLEWNFGGWFGGQLGGTAWILVAAVLVAFRDPQTGLWVGLMFLVPNLVGTLLWRRRERLSCYTAMQILLPVVGAFGLLTVYLLDRSNEWEGIQTGGAVSAEHAYVLICLVVVVLIAMFYVRFGRGSG